MALPVRKNGLRRSKLITPADNWDLMLKASRSEADIIHLEMEDGVIPERKDMARELCLKAMLEIDWGGKELWVRVNHYDSGMAEQDVDVLTAGVPNLIQLPKTQGPEDMHRLEGMVATAERKHGIKPGTVTIGAVLERVRGLSRVEEIAAATPRMGAITFGVEDMANEYRYRQTREPGRGFETMYARSRIVLAARVAGIDCLDSPYVRFQDLEASDIEARFTAQLGFDGKSAVSPKQIPGINAAFTPSPKEIRWANEVMDAVRRAEGSGTAVFAVDGMMV
ncbi:MAG TPA: CoA ester lyase, partial [Rhabdaerophilum sp.]|nr:CoA ester lyase [Rhabdaerophilum sp.]